MLYYVTLAVLAVNAILCVTNGWMAWRHYRAIRHWFALDQLLTSMAFMSFVNHHIPIWKAWGSVMGDMDVDIKVNRKLPKAGD